MLKNMSAIFTNASLNQECPITLEFDPRNISSFPRSAISAWTTLSVINGIAAPPTFYINLLVIWTVLEREHLRSISYNLLLAILSLTDILVGLVVNPLFISMNVCFMVGCASTCSLTVAYVIAVILCGGWSAVTLAIISVERYISTEHPIFYTANVTTKKVMTATAISWILVAVAFVFGRLRLNGSYNSRQMLAPLIIGVSVIVIFFCLVKVNLTARRQMRAIHTQAAAIQGSNTNRIKEYKRTFALGIVVLASVLFYFPLLVVKIIALAKGNEWNTDFNYISQHIYTTFVHLQSLVNPLIFSLRLSYIRAGVIEKLCWH